MLVSFQGCRAIGRDAAATRCARWPFDRRELHWGGKLVSDGTHPIEQNAEKYFGVDPRDDRVVTIVRQSVESAQRLPSLELKFDLPPKAIGLETSRRGHSFHRHGSQQYDVSSSFQAVLRDMRRPVLLA